MQTNQFNPVTENIIKFITEREHEHLTKLINEFSVRYGYSVNALNSSLAEIMIYISDVSSKYRYPEILRLGLPTDTRSSMTNFQSSCVNDLYNTRDYTIKCYYRGDLSEAIESTAESARIIAVLALDHCR